MHSRIWWSKSSLRGTVDTGIEPTMGNVVTRCELTTVSRDRPVEKKQIKNNKVNTGWSFKFLNVFQPITSEMVLTYLALFFPHIFYILTFCIELSSAINLNNFLQTKRNRKREMCYQAHFSGSWFLQFHFFRCLFVEINLIIYAHCLYRVVPNPDEACKANRSDRNNESSCTNK